MKTLTLHTDGGSRGNPGPAAIGAVISDAAGATLAEISEYIGETTNNQAEYQALHAGLKKCHQLGAQEAHCFLDSELLVKQLNREYKVKDPGLAVWYVKVWNLCQEFQRVSFTHIPRAQNTAADRLVNEALDSRA